MFAMNTNGGPSFTGGLFDSFDGLLSGAVAGYNAVQAMETSPSVKVNQGTETSQNNQPYPGLGGAPYSDPSHSKTRQADPVSLPPAVVRDTMNGPQVTSEVQKATANNSVPPVLKIGGITVDNSTLLIAGALVAAYIWLK